MYASICGAAVEIRPFDYLSSNSRCEDTVWWVV